MPADKKMEMLIEAQKCDKGHIMTVSADLRNFRGMPNFEIEWEEPVFNEISPERKAAMRKADTERRQKHENAMESQKRATIYDWLVRHFTANPDKSEIGVSQKEWRDGCQWGDDSRASSTFSLHIKRLRDDGSVEQIDPDSQKSKWRLKS